MRFQVAFKTQPGNFKKLSIAETVDLVKDCFTCAGERDIYTGTTLVQHCTFLKEHHSTGTASHSIGTELGSARAASQYRIASHSIPITGDSVDIMVITADGVDFITEKEPFLLKRD